MSNESSFRFVYDKAQQAGLAAAAKANVVPMVVQDANVVTGQPLAGGKQYFVEGGVCGFAWVKIKGNTAFGRWAKKAGLARSAYPTGLQFWIGDHGQSMQRKEDHANAMAKVLRDHGIDAWAQSRMD